MKKLHKGFIALLIISSTFFYACKDDSDSPEPNDNQNDPTEIPTVNEATFASKTISLTNITCAANAFGIPRFVFTAKNSDNSVSVKVELRGTAPETGSKFSIDPDLGNKTSRVKVYYDSKNWTSSLNANNMISYLSDDTKQNVQGTDVEVVNDADAAETMTLSFNITCE